MVSFRKLCRIEYVTLGSSYPQFCRRDAANDLKFRQTDRLDVFIDLLRFYSVRKRFSKYINIRILYQIFYSFKKTS